MNSKQALALALGTVAAILLVVAPVTQTPPHRVSTQTLPNGTIVTTYRSQRIIWQPVVFGLVVLATGWAVYRLRSVRV